MGMAILRDGDVISVAVTTNASTTDVIDLRRYHRGIVVIPSGSSITELTWQVCDTADGTYVGSSPDVVYANQFYPIDSNVMCAPYAKLVGDASGTVKLFLKG